MIKKMAGLATTFVYPQCRFDRAIFVLGHMRCGSTALSHILCGHPEISGYGEAHIRYDSHKALGMLALNQLRRRAFQPKARHLFDKILHSRYDEEPHPDFFHARAIFLVREPVATILSIRQLFRTIGSGEYATDGQAASYYEKRMEQLIRAWDHFPEDQRIGFSFEQLTTSPDAALAAISRHLELAQPLANHYAPTANAMIHGSGDPLSAQKFNGIVASRRSTTLANAHRSLDIPPSRVARLEKLYETASRLVG